MSPDGVTAFHSERDQIVAQLKQQASRVGWPKNQLDRLSEAYDDGLACWWIREGDRDSVRVSPDTGPAGQRAQRIEIQQAGQGIGAVDRAAAAPHSELRVRTAGAIAGHDPSRYCLATSTRKPAAGGPNGAAGNGVIPMDFAARPSASGRASRRRCQLPLEPYGGRSRAARGRAAATLARRSHRWRRPGRHRATARIAAAAPALARRQFCQQLSLAGWCRADRCTSHAAQLRLGRRRDEPVRHRRVPGVLPRRGLRADDLCERGQWHA